MYKEDLALNILEWLMCHKTKPNQTSLTFSVYNSTIRLMVVEIFQKCPPRFIDT